MHHSPAVPGAGCPFLREPCGCRRAASPVGVGVITRAKIVYQVVEFDLQRAGADCKCGTLRSTPVRFACQYSIAWEMCRTWIEIEPWGNCSFVQRNEEILISYNCTHLQEVQLWNRIQCFLCQVLSVMANQSQCTNLNFSWQIQSPLHLCCSFSPLIRIWHTKFMVFKDKHETQDT